MAPLIILIVLPGSIIFFDFIAFLFRRKRFVNKYLIGLAEVGSLFILPYLYANFGVENLCCRDEIDTAAFSPKHQLTIVTIIVLSLISYYYSKFRKNISPPIIEILVNAFILIGTALNMFIAFHTTEAFYAVFGSVPIICLGILMLIQNQKLFIENSTENRKSPYNRAESIAWSILSSKPLVKFPILLIICLPLLLLLSAALLLFGQKPDSIIRAFTDTYRHGLSQWDYKCANIKCGGHYLCSVAANGHKKIVRPTRLGTRNGNLIVCNRQLLVANAFEDILVEKMPFLHRIIRMNYNKVGKFIHRYYTIFNIKLVSDFVYISMKPFEYIFLITIYLVDRHPENRIAKQYVGKSERLSIDQLQKVGK